MGKGRNGKTKNKNYKTGKKGFAGNLTKYKNLNIRRDMGVFIKIMFYLT